MKKAPDWRGRLNECGHCPDDAEAALLFSVPLLIAQGKSRRDFAAILLNVRNLPKLAAVFLVGASGLALYDIGLSSSHPIITAAILNLTPFWAALVAFVVSKRSVSVSPSAFFGFFFVAFCGAMAIAWSQIDADNNILAHAVIESALHSKWIYALPAPIFFALGGTLVFRWFSEFDEAAAIAANFVVSSLVLIPVAVATSNFGARMSEQSGLAILLLLFGTLAASAAGRVFYQTALTATQNDNGYVTMFFLLTPVLTPLISLPLSRWIPDLQFVVGPLFLIGTALVTVPLLLFSLMAWRGASRATCADCAVLCVERSWYSHTRRWPPNFAAGAALNRDFSYNAFVEAESLRRWGSIA